MKQTTESSALRRPPSADPMRKCDKETKRFKSCYPAIPWFYFVYEAIPMKRLIWNRHTKLVLKHVLGWFFIATGIIMLITPGQGLLSILIGVYLLADHVPMFGRLKVWLHRKFPKAADFVHHKGEQMKAKFHKKEP